MPFAHLKDMPAIRWKLVNLEKFARAKPKVAAEHYEVLAARFAALAA